MKTSNNFFTSLRYDISSGIVVFLVAVPLCLGIALASGAPLYSGMIAGMVGGIIVASLSNSQLSVSGPAAGLSAIVLSAITQLGAFETFLLAVVLAGALQLIMGLIRLGTIADYFPSNVIKGMLTAIGVIIILKQIPHAVGYDKDSEGDFAFLQPDGENTFSEILTVLSKMDAGALIISSVSLIILILWERPFMKKARVVPGALVAVLAGTLINQFWSGSSSAFTLSGEHLVNIPVANSFNEFLNQFTFPDFSQILNPKVLTVAFTIAIVASIETLLSIEAIDKLDPNKRHTNTNLELKAQGLGNMVSGLLGGLPLTSVIVRSSANLNSGARSKKSAIIHGLLILFSVALIPGLLNAIPLSALAAILLITGYKLAKPAVFKQMFAEGRYQWVPFMITLIAIVFTNLLAGVAIGLAVSIFAILQSNLRNPYYVHSEEHQEGNVVKIDLSEIVSFLNKASIKNKLDSIPENSSVIIDASETKYIDHDVLELIREFNGVQAADKNIKVVLAGFKEEYKLPENTVDIPEERLFSLKMSKPTKWFKEQLESLAGKFNAATQTSETQKQITPPQALQILKEGNLRFIHNLRANRNLLQQMNETKENQYPFATVLSCIDSRTSAELIFDQGLGDIFSIRVAGNVINDDVLGSMEFACKVAGSKIIVVLGHSKCGAIKGACDHVHMGHLTKLIDKIKPAVAAEIITKKERSSKNSIFVENVAEINVRLGVQHIIQRSAILREMIAKGEIGIIGAMYDIESGKVHFYDEECIVDGKSELLTGNELATP